MGITQPLTTFTVNVFVRHSAACKADALANKRPKQLESDWKRCDCRKSLSLYDGGRVTYKSAKTRSWKQAELAAKDEYDARNPVLLALAQIEDQEAAKVAEAAALKADRITVAAALDRWLATHKGKAESTDRVYRGFVRKVKAWAQNESIIALADVTPGSLDLWRSQWGPEAEREDDRLGATSQWTFQSRLKGFFAWATRIRLIDRDPSVHLSAIAPSNERTMPLTPSQYAQLLAATELHDPTQRYKKANVGKELYALFFLQRWTGLRISDVLQMRRDYIDGHLISLITLKTKAHYEGTVDQDVLEVIVDCLPPRERVHPDYLFWSRKCSGDTLLATWLKRIKKLNKHLNFVDEQGQPMEFHSHMLRDTFAVELLLDGMAIEKVSRLLTHENVAMTERYYGRWVKSRRLQLQEELVEATRRMKARMSA